MTFISDPSLDYKLRFLFKPFLLMMNRTCAVPENFLTVSPNLTENFNMAKINNMAILGGGGGGLTKYISVLITAVQHVFVHIVQHVFVQNSVLCPFT